VLSENIEQLKKVAEALLEFETIDGEDIDVVLGGGQITRRPPPPLRPSAEAIPTGKEKRPSIFARPTPVLKEEPEKA
jgi:cell division protease FtsH